MGDFVKSRKIARPFLCILNSAPEFMSLFENTCFTHNLAGKLGHPGQFWPKIRQNICKDIYFLRKKFWIQKFLSIPKNSYFGKKCHKNEQKIPNIEIFFITEFTFVFKHPLFQNPILLSHNRKMIHAVFFNFFW